MNLLDLLYIPLALATSPWWALKKRSGWRERFGKIKTLPPPRANTAGRVLLHAVSVGEVAALRHLVPLLSEHADVVISASTDTGIKRARELFGTSCHIVRYPLDFSWSVDRFLNAVKPDVVALVELEVWPNFVQACTRRGLPVCIINGRLSERSARGYTRIRGYFAGVLSHIRWAAVQDEPYARRFIALGIAPEACLITGSMKWDAAKIQDREFIGPAAKALAAEMGIDLARPLIVAGSTGPGEEALLHRVCPPGVQLLCAPRKVDRFDEAAAAMPGCIRRSKPPVAPAEAPADNARFLLDTIGELSAVYSLATVVVVGRSFGGLYGSDPIEPIALGKPTVIGPSVSDFAGIVEVFQRGGGIVQTDAEKLKAQLADLMVNRARREAMTLAGRACIIAHQGASERHAQLLLKEMEKRRKSSTVSGTAGSNGQSRA